MAKPIHHSDSTSTETQYLKEGVCPSCHQQGHFHYLGEQHWPERVARRLGVSSVSLWICGICESTIDGRSLHP